MAEPYVVTATNPDVASENRIHSDAVARRHGFRGGLVPGAVLYRYLCPAAVVALGADWLGRGRAEVRFLSPVYDGDPVRVSSQLDVAAGAAIQVENEAGTVCVTAVVEIPAGAALPDADAYAARPAPADRPLISREALEASTDLGAIRFDVETDGAHPATFLHLANRLLTANFVMPAWIHTGSSVQHFAELSPGDAVEARGRVARLFERKGHQLLELDVLVLANGRPAATVAHTAIYELAS